MAEKIVRHFKRIYYPRAEDVTIDWPLEPVGGTTAQVDSIYDGDTLHVFGRFKEQPIGDVTLKARLENGETLTQSLSVRETANSESETDVPSTPARMAAAYDLKSLTDPGAISALAVKYQLMSQWTNYIAIDVKADGEKAGDMPALRKTPQMLAAGWGGSGTVTASALSQTLESRTFYQLAAEPISIRYDVENLYRLKKQDQTRFAGIMEDLHAGFHRPYLRLLPIEALRLAGVRDRTIRHLIALRDIGIDEDLVVIVCLYLLSHEGRTSPLLQEMVKESFRQLGDIPEAFIGEIESLLLRGSP
jgi:Ca-activated chloride channel family protein